MKDTKTNDPLLVSEMFISDCFDDALEKGLYSAASRLIDLFPMNLSKDDQNNIKERIQKTADNLDIICSILLKKEYSEESFHYLLAILENECDFPSYIKIREFLKSFNPGSEQVKKLFESLEKKLQEKKEQYRVYEHIHGLYREHQYQRVIDECNDLLSSEPDDIDALLYLYRARRNINKIHYISNIIQEEKQLADSDNLLYKLINLSRYLSKDSPSYRKVMELLGVFISNKQKKFRIHTLVEAGYKCIENGDIDSAARYAKNAIELDENNIAANELLKSLKTVKNFEVLLSQGKSLFYKGEFKKALEAFRECVAIAGKTQDLKDFISKIEYRLELEDLYNKGILFYKKEDWKNAIILFEQILQKEKNYKKSEKLLLKARQKMDIEDLYQKIENSLSNNHIEDAKYMLSKIREIDPAYSGISQLEDRLNSARDFQGLLMESKEQLDKKNFDKAREIIEEALDIDPTHNQALKLYKRIEEDEKISEILEDALNAFSEERYDEILKLCRKGLLIQPDNKELRQLNENAREQSRNREKLFEARALLAKDKLGDANKIVLNILKMDPENKEGKELQNRIERKIHMNNLLSKGLSHLQKKDLEGAGIIFNEALKIEPENKKIREYLAKIESVINRENKDEEEITKVNRIPIEKSYEKITELMNSKEFDIALAYIETILEENPEDEKILRLKKKLKKVLERLDELEKEAIDTFQEGDFNTSLLKWKKLLSNIHPGSSRYQTVHLQFQGVLEAMSHDLINKAETNIANGNIERARNTISVLSKLPIEGISHRIKELNKALK